jgi:hypothetical protein
MINFYSSTKTFSHQVLLSFSFQKFFTQLIGFGSAEETKLIFSSFHVAKEIICSKKSVIELSECLLRIAIIELLPRAFCLINSVTLPTSSCLFSGFRDEGINLLTID